MASQITTRLFLGVLVTAELKMHMAQSNAWRDAAFSAGGGGHPLSVVRFQRKEYLGHYLATDEVSLGDLEEASSAICALLEKLFPDFDVDKCTPALFPQVFVH